MICILPTIIRTCCEMVLGINFSCLTTICNRQRSSRSVGDRLLSLLYFALLWLCKMILHGNIMISNSLRLIIIPRRSRGDQHRFVFANLWQMVQSRVNFMFNLNIRHRQFILILIRCQWWWRRWWNMIRQHCKTLKINLWFVKMECYLSSPQWVRLTDAMIKRAILSNTSRRTTYIDIGRHSTVQADNRLCDTIHTAFWLSIHSPVTTAGGTGNSPSPMKIICS